MPVVTEYKYDPDGNRVAKTVDGVTTNYLVDSLNHTGYSQVFIETTGTNKTSYIIGDDVLAQATGDTADAPKYLLYDGHGSTRQLSNNAGDLISNESYSYDAYGVLLGGPRTTQTNLLYTGEMYDSNAEMYYLRARYYDPLNGRFNSVDPFAGSPQDPQSLHKYLYAHNNPVNAADPSGCFTVLEISLAIAVFAVMFSIGWFATCKIRDITTKEVIKGYDAWLTGGSRIKVKIDGKETIMSAQEILLKYKKRVKDIAVQYGVPSDLLAGVLYTEMRHYATHDLLFDDTDRTNSIGPAQLEVSHVKKYLSSDYGSVPDNKMADLLYNPNSAIEILAKCILYIDRVTLSIGLIEQFKAASDINKRAELSARMSLYVDISYG